MSKQQLNSEPSPSSLADPAELGKILRVIYLRLKRDGYELVDGKVVKLDNYEKNEGRTNDTQEY